MHGQVLLYLSYGPDLCRLTHQVFSLTIASVPDQLLLIKLCISFLFVFPDIYSLAYLLTSNTDYWAPAS